jgi:peptidyl-dipeptidase A
MRKLKFLKNIGTAALDSANLTILTSTRSNMSAIYNQAKICPPSKRVCDLATEGWTLDPEIELALAHSTDFDEQKYIWEEWREVSGRLMREQYKVYIEKNNLAATLNGFDGENEKKNSIF